MLRRRVSNKQKARSISSGQTFIEYTIVIGAVVMAILAMSTAVKRGTQGMIKVVADEVGVQEDADQAFDETGHLESSITTTRTTIDKTISEFVGETTYGYDDVTITDTDLSINLGFTEEN